MDGGQAGRQAAAVLAMGGVRGGEERVTNANETVTESPVYYRFPFPRRLLILRLSLLIHS